MYRAAAVAPIKIAALRVLSDQGMRIRTEFGISIQRRVRVRLLLQLCCIIVVASGAALEDEWNFPAPLGRYRPRHTGGS